MSTKTKRLMIAAFFLLLAIFMLISLITQGFSSSMTLYLVIFLGISALFIKNAFRP